MGAELAGELARRRPRPCGSLRSEVHRWAVFCDDEVTPAELAPEIRDGGFARALATPRTHVASLAAAVRDTEHAAIAAALAAHTGNLSQTARALGIERNTLKRKLAALGLATSRSRPRSL